MTESLDFSFFPTRTFSAPAPHSVFALTCFNILFLTHRHCCNTKSWNGCIWNLSGIFRVLLTQRSRVITGKVENCRCLTLTDQHRGSRTVSVSLQLGVSPAVKTVKKIKNKKIFTHFYPQREDSTQVRTVGVRHLKKSLGMCWSRF